MGYYEAMDMGQLPFYAFAFTVVIFLVLSLFKTTRPGTIQQYFWGDGKLSQRSVVSLLLSNSFSLNGLLYQVWLGYLIGWWSIGIQLVWCASFVVLMCRPERLASIIHRGTLHGVVAERFGTRAGKLAALASIIGFAGLIGWEAVVGATLLRQFGGVSVALFVVLPILLALVSAYYTRSGGLHGNGRMNLIQNRFKALVLIGAACALVFFLSEHGLASPGSNKTLCEALTALGGVALVANLSFSLLWQIVDMSLWQSLAGLVQKNEPNAARQLKSAIGGTAISVLVFPGLIGTVIGVTIAGLPVEASDMNILNVFVTQVSQYPFLALFLIGAFAAAMLSTIDGYSLAASQAISWDLARTKVVKKLLALEEPRDATNEDRMVISLSRAMVFLVGVGGAVMMISLVFGLNVGLFDLVYAVVVGQMSLSGPVLVTLFGREQFRVKYGSLPIGLSLVCGLVALALGVTIAPNALTWAPVITIAISILLSLLLYSRADITDNEATPHDAGHGMVTPPREVSPGAQPNGA